MYLIIFENNFWDRTIYSSGSIRESISNNESIIHYQKRFHLVISS